MYCHMYGCCSCASVEGLRTILANGPPPTPTSLRGRPKLDYAGLGMRDETCFTHRSIRDQMEGGCESRFRMTCPSAANVSVRMPSPLCSCAACYGSLGVASPRHLDAPVVLSSRIACVQQCKAHPMWLRGTHALTKATSIAKATATTKATSLRGSEDLLCKTDCLSGCRSHRGVKELPEP